MQHHLLSISGYGLQLGVHFCYGFLVPLLQLRSAQLEAGSNHIIVNSERLRVKVHSLDNLEPLQV